MAWFNNHNHPNSSEVFMYIEAWQVLQTRTRSSCYGLLQTVYIFVIEALILLNIDVSVQDRFPLLEVRTFIYLFSSSIPISVFPQILFHPKFLFLGMSLLCLLCKLTEGEGYGSCIFLKLMRKLWTCVETTITPCNNSKT